MLLLSLKEASDRGASRGDVITLGCVRAGFTQLGGNNQLQNNYEARFRFAFHLRVRIITFVFENVTNHALKRPEWNMKWNSNCCTPICKTRIPNKDLTYSEDLMGKLFDRIEVM